MVRGILTGPGYARKWGEVAGEVTTLLRQIKESKP